MDKFLQEFAKSKIPTLIVMGAFLYFGANLILSASNFNTPAAIEGTIVLAIGIVAGVMTFIDYRYKEQTDGVISNLEKALDVTSRILKNTSDTANAREKSTQETLKSEDNHIYGGRQGKSKYKAADGDGTATR